VRRVSIVGNSGSGKTSLARALAARLRVPHIELDAIFHQRGWTELPVDDFRERVDGATSGDGWVVDGNYSAVRDIIWRRADTVVWLDLPRRVVMPRIIRRSAVRAALRRELWNGNRERWRNLVSLNPQESVIAWSWQNHARQRARYAAAMADPQWQHVDFVALHTPREVKAFLATA
jgi:adenylate kinase family enzyme